jgi:hypothetical protein
MKSKLIQLYRQMQKDIKVRKNKKYATLVNPSNNHTVPIHNWYHFKEAYSPYLLSELIKDTNISDKIRIFDPFCGCGTTLLSAALNTEIEVDFGLGIEVNPFIHFVTKTKLNFYKINPERIEKFINKIKQLELSDKEIIPEELLQLSTISKAFSKNTLSQIIHLKNLIKHGFNENEYEHDFLMLSFASILEKVSCMRKSGRALKIVKDKADYNVKEYFVQKTENMLNEAVAHLKTHYPVNLITFNEDIRRLNITKNNVTQFNLVVFSPPYLNHFDYTEVYKIELWMLDFVKNHEQFKALRYKTFRSHPSVKFAETSVYKQFKSSHIHNIVDLLNNSPNPEACYRSIKGYIDDMYKTFVNIYNATVSNAIVVCVVGNSLFGSAKKNNFLPVATDLLISEIAKDVGFEVIELKVARKVTRRGLAFPYGRESLIFFKKEHRTGKSLDFSILFSNI